MLHITSDHLELSVKLFTLLLLLLHVSDESGGVYLCEAIFDFRERFSFVVVPAGLNLFDLDLKSLLLLGLLCDLAVKHGVSLLELGTFIRLLYFSLNSNSNLHRLLSDFVLLDKSRVFAKLSKRLS